MPKETLADRRVAAGAAWLDANARVPSDWRKKINLATLHMDKPGRCILGQLFGDYWDAVKMLKLTSGQTHELGLIPGSGVNLVELDRAWTAYISATNSQSSEPKPVSVETITELLNTVKRLRELDSHVGADAVRDDVIELIREL